MGLKYIHEFEKIVCKILKYSIFKKICSLKWKTTKPN